MLPGPWCVFSFLVKPTKLVAHGTAVLLCLIRVNRRRAGQARVLPWTVHARGRLQPALERHGDRPVPVVHDAQRRRITSAITDGRCQVRDLRSTQG